MSSKLIAGTATSGAALSADTTGILEIQTGSTPTTAITIDASQNVGIGTASPLALVDVSKSTTDATTLQEIARITRTGGSSTTPTNYRGALLSFGDSSNFTLTSAIGGLRNTANLDFSGSLAFYTNSGGSSASSVSALTERMRIDSSGNLLVNTTSQVGSGKISLVANGSTNNAMEIKNSDSGNNIGYMQFKNSAGNNAGYINQTGATTVAYTSVSDYRLKENIAPMTGALDKVFALKPCTYTWKLDGTVGQGFIAHELAEVCPDAVVGKKDDVNKDGSIKTQSIDTSFLVATLTAALQELNAKVDAQAAEIKALKGVA